jgi:hypothetical protein
LEGKGEKQIDLRVLNILENVKIPVVSVDEAKRSLNG